MSSITSINNLASGWLTSAWSDIQYSSAGASGIPILDALGSNSSSSASSTFSDADFITLSGTLSGAGINQAQGLAQIAAQKALTRIQNDAAAKIAAAQNSSSSDASSVWQNKPLPTSVSAGNSTVNFSANTLTLSDGTVIDLMTGLPRLNVVV